MEDARRRHDITSRELSSANPFSKTGACFTYRQVPCEQEFEEVFGRKSEVLNPYEIKDGKWRLPNRPGPGVGPDLAAIDAITVGKQVFRP